MSLFDESGNFSLPWTAFYLSVEEVERMICESFDHELIEILKNFEAEADRLLNTPPDETPPSPGDLAHLTLNLDTQSRGRGRRFNPEATQCLISWVQQNWARPYPSKQVLGYLSGRTSLSQNQVSTWLVNYRRRVWRPFKKG